jgi:hypothetical protein
MDKPRKRKSEQMTPEERRAFRKWVGEQPTKIDAAAALPVSIGTLDRLLILGSGSPETIQKVREIAIQSHAA